MKSIPSRNAAAERVMNNKGKKKEYPKTFYVRQTCNAVDKGEGNPRYITYVSRNKKDEEKFRFQCAEMEPNFTHEISLTPFITGDTKPCAKCGKLIEFNTDHELCARCATAK